MPDSRTIHLWPDGSKQNVAPANPDSEPRPGWYPAAGRPRLEVYTPSPSVWATENKRGCVIICPGGGYGGLASHEGEPLARLFAMHGIVGCVLTYRVSPNRFPAPYNDACRAVRMVRSMSEELGIDPQRVAIMGFSAGGHLASTVATQPELHLEPDDDLASRISARPDRVILGYPVISFVTNYHVGCAANLLGADPSLELRTRFSNELHVTKDNPPAFLFHTGDDPGVLVQNSLMFASAYAREKIPCELHVYRTGKHGVGMALDDPALRSWTPLLIDWLGDWATGI